MIILSQFCLFAALNADRSAWIDLRSYPSTVVCRRMLRLADWAAEFPRRYAICRMSWECRELSFTEIAAIRETTLEQVCKAIAAVEFDDAADFADDELVLDNARRPAPAGREFDPETASLTYTRSCLLCDYAAANPVRWRVIREAHRDPELTQEELAAICGCNQSTVSRALEIRRIEDEDEPVELSPEELHEYEFMNIVTTEDN